MLLTLITWILIYRDTCSELKLADLTHAKYNNKNISKPLLLYPIVAEPMPHEIILRNSFMRARRLLILQWLTWATILSLAYKSTLLSTLITIRYTDTIDTIDQMVESGLPFYIQSSSVLNWIAVTDPRDSIKRLNERRVDVPHLASFLNKEDSEVLVEKASLTQNSKLCFFSLQY